MSEPHPGQHPYPLPAPTLTAAQERDYRRSRTVWTLAVLALPFFWLYSLFAGMATAACSGSDQCSNTLINVAYVVGWPGAAAAAILSRVLMSRARKQGRPELPWSVRGAAMIAACVVGWGLLLAAGLGSI